MIKLTLYLGKESFITTKKSISSVFFNNNDSLVISIFSQKCTFLSKRVKMGWQKYLWPPNIIEVKICNRQTDRQTNYLLLQLTQNKKKCKDYWPNYWTRRLQIKIVMFIALLLAGKVQLKFVVVIGVGWLEVVAWHLLEHQNIYGIIKWTPS